MKLCRDCRAVLVTEDGTRMCMHPATAKWFPDYYNGGERLEHPSIEVARTIGECGPDATLWESKG